MFTPTEWLMVLVRHADRGPLVTQMLAAADALGIDRHHVRSQTDGFLIPIEIDRYLNPSKYEQKG